MKQFFAYIRVSTVKQGEKGVSLQEQRDAIARFSARQNLAIHSWFEERETAAKRGRPVFGKMLALLRRGAAAGVIIHRIDRSARNLKDWADLGELIDSGIEVLFASESLDLHSRGGRLSADIQAVVAADYIRNLREETKKGFYGRLKQGIYPLGAPAGYINNGGGKPKTIDPVLGPVVRKAFELYASGRYTLETLADEVHSMGLRNQQGGKWSMNGISVMLRNPFYIGIIRLRKTAETFPGIHAPLIPKRIFDQVQEVLKGRINTRTIRHDFLFRRLLRCATCGRALIGEMQRCHVYYRCHTKGCITVREEAVESAVCAALKPLIFSDKEKAILMAAIEQVGAQWRAWKVEAGKAIAMRTDKLNDRMQRLTDALIDGLIDKDAFEQRKGSLLAERQEIGDAEARLAASEQEVATRVQRILEQAESAYLLYQTAEINEKRELIRIVTSNRTVSREKVEITLAEPFLTISSREAFTSGALGRGIPRTISEFVGKILKHHKAVDTRKNN